MKKVCELMKSDNLLDWLKAVEIEIQANHFSEAAHHLLGAGFNNWDDEENVVKQCPFCEFHGSAHRPCQHGYPWSVWGMDKLWVLITNEEAKLMFQRLLVCRHHEVLPKLIESMKRWHYDPVLPDQVPDETGEVRSKHGWYLTHVNNCIKILEEWWLSK